jgi:DNA-directed RNA polymerase specialized sigma24 family protein
MTAREYLGQAYRLEQRIRLKKEELENLRTLSVSVGSPGFDEHYNPNRPTDASFVKTLDRIWEEEKEVSNALCLLLKLKKEIQSVIDQVDNIDERLVLTYRYLKGYTWMQIGDELLADERTVRRWHDRALAHVRVPKKSLTA